jgi:hypothetical protein
VTLLLIAYPGARIDDPRVKKRIENTEGVYQHVLVSKNTVNYHRQRLDSRRRAETAMAFKL